MQVATQLKDVIREVQELKDASLTESENSPQEDTSALINPATSCVEGLESALKGELRGPEPETQSEEVDIDLDYQADSASPEEVWGLLC